MLSHLSFGVEDLTRSTAFYEKALAPLGVVCVWRNERGSGFGEPGGNDKLALFARPGKVHAPGEGFHLCFEAKSREAVEAFYVAAMAAGATDAGAPGLRERYSPTYYAAFVLDPDGYKLEAVHQ